MMQLVNPEEKIYSKNLVLEPILPKHAALLFADLQSPKLFIFIPHEPPTSIDSLRKRYERWCNRQSNDATELWLNYAIILQKNDEYVGTVQATIQSTTKIYIAYEVFPRYWRCSIAKEACSTLISHLFTSYSLEKISALVDTRNEASWRLLEALRFHRIATIENADYFKGARSDEYLYEIDRSKHKES